MRISCRRKLTWSPNYQRRWKLVCLIEFVSVDNTSGDWVLHIDGGPDRFAIWIIFQIVKKLYLQSSIVSRWIIDIEILTVSSVLVCQSVEISCLRWTQGSDKNSRGAKAGRRSSWSRGLRWGCSVASKSDTNGVEGVERIGGIRIATGGSPIWAAISKSEYEN